MDNGGVERRKKARSPININYEQSSFTDVVLSPVNSAFPILFWYCCYCCSFFVVVAAAANKDNGALVVEYAL